jgi:hypothetical protein
MFQDQSQDGKGHGDNFIKPFSSSFGQKVISYGKLRLQPLANVLKLFRP